MNSILTEGTGRYRRNSIILAFVLLLMWFVPGTDFSGAGFFGIKIAASDKKAELLVIGVLLGVLAYHFALFVFYAHFDYVDWMEQQSVPLWAVGALFRFGICPKYFSWDGYDNLTNNSDPPHTIRIQSHQIDRPTAQVSLALTGLEVTKPRRGILIFALLDLPIPVALAVWAILLTSWRCYVLATEIWCLY